VALALVIAIATALIVLRPTNKTTTSESNSGPATSPSGETNQTSGRTTFQRFTAIDRGDRDRDGLIDQDETAAGTKLDLADTDGDGLTDYEEVKIYQSNPLKQDSDGDGRFDGEEVKAGYDPNSTGQLRNINQAIQQIK
jgi:hypothetical protein